MTPGRQSVPPDPREEVLLSVLSSMPVAIAWADPGSGRIAFVNRKFSQVFGYVLEELSTVAQWIEDCYADPLQAEETRSFWGNGFLDNSGVLREMEGAELDIRCKDGSIKTVLSGKIMLPERAGALATFLDITPRKQKESQMRRQALEDPLTGLLNRRAFSEQLQDSLQLTDPAADTRVALLLIDLDGFKEVNDRLGHDMGDQLLVKIAERLRHAVRGNDVLCRIGGDEFGVILDLVSQAGTAQMVAERILYGLGRKPYTLGGHKVEITGSIGIAFSDGDTCNEVDFFRKADQALYRAKNSGKNRWSC